MRRGEGCSWVFVLGGYGRGVGVPGREEEVEEGGFFFGEGVEVVFFGQEVVFLERERG